MLSITDTAIVGKIPVDGLESLAAAGIVGSFLSMMIWILGQTRSSISAIISQYLGAGKLEEIKTLPAQAIFFNIMLSIVLLLSTIFIIEEIFMLLEAKGKILSYCVSYYSIRVWGFPLTLFTFAVMGIFRGLQNTYYPMLIAIVGAVTNIILDIILVYGISGYIEPMHIEGAAYASVIAQIFMALFAAYFLLKKTEIPLKPSFPFNPEIERFVLMIFNLFIRTIALNVTLYYASAFATSYGAQYIAGYTIAINLWFLGAFIVDGYASAGNILSGKLYGEKAYSTLITLSNKLIKYGVVIGIILGLTGALFYYPIGKIFTKEPEVLNAFYDIFWIVLVMQPLCTLAFIFDGIFKGLGKMKYLRNVLLFSTFIIFIPILFWLDNLGYKLHAIFIAITFWIIARGIPLIIKFRKIFMPLAQNN